MRHAAGLMEQPSSGGALSVPPPNAYSPGLKVFPIFMASAPEPASPLPGLCGFLHFCVEG